MPLPKHSVLEPLAKHHPTCNMKRLDSYFALLWSVALGALPGATNAALGHMQMGCSQACCIPLARSPVAVP